MELPSMANLMGGIMFSIIGLAALRYGKNMGYLYPQGFGLVLIIYPFFVDNTVLLYLIGVALCAALWIFKDEG